ncbi:CLUMA_CG002682, isoform A [Clunio marinus]|uniref:CLUMA_CG002682, isoform A n=1 Tax=Clunio marinus TaxID=568069 RepID=A0A1J1HRL5_9DIPT|nr:CLUMA_CG002682, isoform A [Clunio marinus]
MTDSIICRVCLENCEKTSPIFDESKNGLSLAMMLMEIGGVEVSIHDSLSKNICEGCSKEMMIGHGLRMRFLNSNQHLKRGTSKLTKDLQRNVIPVVKLSRIDQIKLMIKEEVTDYNLITFVEPEKGLFIDENDYVKTELEESKEVNILDKNISENTSSNLLKVVIKRNNKFVCMICDSCHNSWNLWHKHYSKSHSEMPNVCKVCQASYKDKSELNQHYKSRHMIGDTFICSICNLRFQRKSELFEHQEKHVDDNNSLGNSNNETGFECVKHETDVTENNLIKNSPKYDDIELKENFDDSRSNISDHEDSNWISDTSNDIKTEEKKNVLKKRDDGPLICYICFKYFNSYFTKKSHLEKSHQECTKCQICPQIKFKDVCHYENHMRIHAEGDSKNATKSCDLCKYSSKEKYCLMKHMKAVHLKIKSYKCEQCDASFRYESDYKQHKFGLHKALPARFTCDKCDQGFIFKSKYSRHLEKCHKNPSVVNKLNFPEPKKTDEGGFICSVCGKGFHNDTAQRNRRKWYYHYRNAHYENFNRCKICMKKFSERGKLYEHMKVHGIVNFHVCKVCGIKFVTEKNLTLHVSKVHDGPRKSFNCNECSETFDKRNELMKHVRKEHKEAKDIVVDERMAKDICYICNQPFKSHISKIKHVETVHSDFVQRDCNICEKKSIISPKAYEIHMMEHVKGKNEVCQHCGQSFALFRQLQSHSAQKHAESKMIQCEICGENVHKYKLPVHLIKHNASKFHCELCDKSFASKMLLWNHKFREHGADPKLNCRHCGEGFVLTRACKLHEEKCKSGIVPKRGRPKDSKVHV